MTTRKPRLSPSRLDGALVTLHRFDDRGGEGVNFIELRLRDQQEPEFHVKREGAR